MKALIIGNSKSVFAKELQGELVASGKDVYLVDFAHLELYNSRYELDDRYTKKFAKYKSIPKLHMFFRMMLIKKIITDMNFEVINIHVARWYYRVILKTLSQRKLIISFYGSDFYRASMVIKKLLYPVLKAADIITFTNEKTSQSFARKYSGLQNKIKVCRFGLKTLDFIDKNRDIEKTEIKKELGYSITKTIVTCGHNSTSAQQHEKIIEGILKLPKSILDTTQFIFPMTYGDNLYKEKIKNILEATVLDYIVLEDFLYSDKNAYIKLASDIMINILKTDTFSGSMQEFLYAKNLIITGEWLPYDLFDKEGIVYQKISSTDKLSTKLEEVLTSKEKINLDKNIDIISKLSSWKNNIESWIEAYEN